jgi:hypothetical protein
MAYFKYLDHEPDFTVLTGVMAQLATGATASALQQHFEKKYRDLIVKAEGAPANRGHR